MNSAMRQTPFVETPCDAVEYNSQSHRIHIISVWGEEAMGSLQIARSVVLAGLLFSGVTAAPAQTRPGPLRPANGTAPRAPNDQVEGSVWQFKATRQEVEKPITATFRVEENAILQIEKEIPTEEPSTGTPKRPRDRIKAGGIKLPAAKTKRVGDVTKMDNGKTKLIFTEGPLQGQAIIAPLKDRPGVWSGEYRQRLDDKTEKLGPLWKLELRESED